MPKPKIAPTFPIKPPGMEKSSFTLYGTKEAEVFPRLIVGVKGLEGSGKTNFALTAPRSKQQGTQEGVFYFHVDLGLEGVGHKFVDPFKGPIYKADYLLDVRELHGEDEDAIKKAAAPIAKRFWDDVDLAIKRQVRSMVFDSQSELWELDRLAEWGKLSMKAHHYTPLNARWRRVFKMLSMAKCNAIFLQRLTDEYIDDKATGGYKPQGYKKTGYEVQEYLTAWQDTDHKFHLTVDKSRHDGDLVGLDLESEECTFETLAGRVFPDIDPDFWR